MDVSSEQNAVLGLPNSHYVVSGGEDGLTTCWDIRNVGADGGQPLQTVDCRNRVTRLISGDGSTCWIGNGITMYMRLFTDVGDGSASKWDPTSLYPSVTLISDAEPLYGLVKKRGKIITGSRKAVIRIYDV